MKPKTPIQKEVIRLSATLPELTNAQRTYAFHHCFKHYGRRTAKGVITCTECGHAWKSGHSLADTLCGCTCPNCGTALEITDTRKRVFVDNEYFSIITTCKGYQVIRFFSSGAVRKSGKRRSIPSLRWHSGGLLLTASPRQWQGCVAFHFSTTTCGTRTARWKSAGTTGTGCTT